MSNSVDPDETAHSSGSLLFAKAIIIACGSERVDYKQKWHFYRKQCLAFQAILEDNSVENLNILFSKNTENKQLQRVKMRF